MAQCAAQPVLDGEFSLPHTAPFLPVDPRQAVQTGEYNTEVDLLLGVNRNEGQLLTQILQAGFYYRQLSRFTKNEIKSIFIKQVRVRKGVAQLFKF